MLTRLPVHKQINKMLKHRHKQDEASKKFTNFLIEILLYESCNYLYDVDDLEELV